MSLFLEIRLLDDVAVSERSATVGGHRGLPYLPGSQLLGAVAAARYDSLDAQLVWRIFHAGEVRFGNGYVVGAGGSPALPIPLALHVRKGKEERGRLTAEVINRARDGADEPGVQLEQLRWGFVDAELHVKFPTMRTSLRTAVDRTGRARDGLLFGITGMQEDTVLRARVDADDPALLEPVRQALAGKTVRMGRSKSAEFGRVAVMEIKAWAPPPAKPTPEAHVALFWCVSDSALRRPDTGQITLTPFPEAFGLPSTWLLTTRRSFIRTRRYSPFNAHRMRPDLERQVLTAGSVLCFEGADPLDPAAVGRAVARGVGDYRAEGLGQVLFEPALLAERRLRIDGGATADVPRTEEANIPGPKGALFEWMQQRKREQDRRDDAWEIAMTWVKELEGAKLPATQWGEIRLLARRFADQPEELVAEVQRFTSEGIRKLENRWGRRRQGRMLSEELVALLRELPRRELAGPALELAATHLARRRQEELR